MLLELKNIKKYYPVKQGSLSGARSFVRAVDDVSFSVFQGENISLVGESGCGKTTLARMILRLIPLDSGSVIFNGEDISRVPNRRLTDCRKNMQMVFQDPYSSLDPRFTVRNIMKEAMTLDRGGYSDERQRVDRIRELLSAVGLKGDLLNRFPHEFSGGERQRIAIARALVLNPKLLILDEAVSSLDVIIQQQLICLLADLQRKFDLTYLFISHNLRVVKQISRRIAVMYRGRIVELASTEEIFNNPLHPYTRELLAAAVDYKSVKREEIKISPQSRLVDKGGGHFILEE